METQGSDIFIHDNQYRLIMVFYSLVEQHHILKFHHLMEFDIITLEEGMKLVMLDAYSKIKTVQECYLIMG